MRVSRAEADAPCECAGTLSYIHVSCLKKWIGSRPERDNGGDLECEICHASYEVNGVPVQMREVMQCSSQYLPTSAWRHMLEALLLLFCFACTAFMVFALGPNFNPHPGGSDPCLRKAYAYPDVCYLAHLYNIRAQNRVSEVAKGRISD